MRLGGNQNLENSWEEIAGYENAGRDFPDGPVVGILCFHCRGLGFHSWLGNWNLTSCAAWPKKKKPTGKWNAIAGGLRGAWSPRNLGLLLCFCFVCGVFTPKLNPLPVSLGVFLSITFYPCDNLSVILSGRSLKLLQSCWIKSLWAWCIGSIFPCLGKWKHWNCGKCQKPHLKSNDS